MHDTPARVTWQNFQNHLNALYLYSKGQRQGTWRICLNLPWHPEQQRGGGREAHSQEESPSSFCLPGPTGQEEKVRHRGGSRRVITCATPVTNSGTPSDVSIFSQRHRMVITSRDSLRSSQGIGKGRDRKGGKGHSKHTQWLPDKH